MTKPPSPFATLFAKYCNQKGLMFSQVAEKARLSRSSVGRFAYGKRKPRRETVYWLAHGLGLDEADRDRLLLAAGYAPDDLANVLKEPALMQLNNLLPLVPDEIATEMRKLVADAVTIGVESL